MKITVDMMMAKKPCKRWPQERVVKYLGDGKTITDMLRDSLANNGISMPDVIWGATRFLPDKINRKFAIWCARQCKSKLPEIKSYIDVIKKYYNGKATKEELGAAYWAAYSAADSAAYSAADSAAYSAAYWAAYWAAYSAAYWAADWAAYWAADSAADWAADRKKMRIRQIKKLITLVEGK